GDGEAGRVEVETDGRDLASRNRRADGARVQQTREGEVVDIARRPRDLLDAVLAEDVASDGSSGPRHRAIIYKGVGSLFSPRSTAKKGSRPPYADFFNRRSMIPTTAASSLVSPAPRLASFAARALIVATVAPSM